MNVRDWLSTTNGVSKFSLVGEEGDVIKANVLAFDVVEYLDREIKSVTYSIVEDTYSNMIVACLGLFDERSENKAR